MMDGVIVVNKPKGITSHDVVAKVRRKLNQKRVGHAGTLDPLATGVLLILVGNGTKLSNYLIEHDKTYIATLKLGVKTSTGDCEGEVIERKIVPKLENEKVKEVLCSFIGKQDQIPPMYSSIKVNGKKLYEYARSGISVEVPKRNIEIYDIKLLRIQDNLIWFEVKCSKGTYIRSLCEDISTRLCTVGTMYDLIRTSVNEFEIDKAVKIEDISENDIIPIEDVLKNTNKIVLKHSELEKFLNGIGIDSELDMALVYCNEKFIGVAKNKNGKLVRDIINN